VRPFVPRAFAVVALSCPAIALAVACSRFDEEPPIDSTIEAGGEGGTPPDASNVDSGHDGGDSPAVECPSSACSVLAEGQTDAREVVTDGVDVFWTRATNGSGSVRAAPLAGGAPPRLVSGPEDQPKSLQLFEELVRYATGGAVHQVRKDGSTDAGAKGYLRSGGGDVTSALRFGTTVYFTYEDKLGRCGPPLAPCIGNSPTVQVGLGAGALTFAPGGPPYFVHVGAIWQVDADNNRADIRFEVTGIRALAADATNLYFLRTGKKTVETLQRSAARPTIPTTLAEESEEPRAIAIDGSDLYFTTLQTGTVSRVAKFGGTPPVVVVKGLVSPDGIAVSDDRIVVVANGSIVSIPKPPRVLQP